MPTLTKKQYAEMYKRDEYKPAGICSVICLLTTLAIVAAIIFGISRFAGHHRASGQTPQIINKR